MSICWCIYSQLQNLTSIFSFLKGTISIAHLDYNVTASVLCSTRKAMFAFACGLGDVPCIPRNWKCV